MSSPFVAEIRIFAFNFPPKGWAFCAGQIMPLSQNVALFSLLGTTYGGDGKSNFALPNLQGCAPMHQGQGAGLSLRDLGETGGEQSVALLSTELPNHSHVMNADTGLATTADPTNAVYMKGNFDDGNGHTGGVQVYDNVAPTTAMSPLSVAPAGGGLPHNNMMPYRALNFCIAMQGVYPPRT